MWIVSIEQYGSQMAVCGVLGTKKKAKAFFDKYVEVIMKRGEYRNDYSNRITQKFNDDKNTCRINICIPNNTRFYIYVCMEKWENNTYVDLGGKI